MASFAESLQVYLSVGLLRLPLSWVSVLAGPVRIVDGQALDVRTQWLLRLIAAANRPSINELPIERARSEFEMSMNLLGGWRQPVGEIVDRVIPGPAGKLPVRVYRPEGASAGKPRGILVYFHGGGWTIGSIASHDKPCRYLCAKSGCIVVSVEYRLAPEHKFPSAIDDCVAAYRWVAENAAALGGDERHVAVGGDFAGGTLAAAVSLVCRDADGPKPAFQLLICPSTDLSGNYPSYQSCGEGYLLTRPMIEWFRDHYLHSPADVADPRVSPLRAETLENLPPAFLCTAGFDPLRDEGKAYADRLQGAGVATIYRNFESLVHGFVGFAGTVSAAARAMDEIAFALRQGLAFD